MKKLMISIAGAGLLAVAIVATVVAAGPARGPGPQAGAGDTIPTALGLTRTEIMELREQGMSLAQIADRQEIDAQVLVDALASRWTERIEARVEAGALTDEEAAQLKSQVELRAKAQVSQAAPGGMRGVAVGAGNGQGNGGGGGAGTGICDGTGSGYRGGRG